MIPTHDAEIVDEGWYWVKQKPHQQMSAQRPVPEPKWEIMQARVTEASGSFDWASPREIHWWEVMKDWATDHDEIAIVGPKIQEPE